IGVSPTLIYLLLFCVCFSWFLHVNFAWLSDYFYRRKKRNERIWDMSVVSAIIHIASDSPNSIGRTQKSAIEFSVKDFCARAEAGRIRVRGVPAGSTIPVTIPRREWATSELDKEALQDLPRSTGGKLICANSEKTLRYTNLMVDKEE